MLSLKLLGQPVILSGGQPVGRFRSTKSLALLAYLALEQGVRHDRANLVTLFWPDLTEEKARQNLSQTLTRLRDALGPAGHYIRATHRSIWLEEDAPVDVDVATFRQLFSETEQHSHDAKTGCADCQEKLARAVDLARGELLAGLQLNDSDIFEEWLRLESERLHQLLLRALADLAEGALAAARYEAAIQYARRQIALESWRELAHRQLMRALAHNGQREAALAQYEKCRQLLQQELGVEPTSATRQLAADIRAGKLGSSAPPAAPSPNTNLPSALTPFIGRSVELVEIYQQLQSAAARLVTITGLGGTGKTRLALEIGHRIAAEPAGRREGVCLVPLAGVGSAENIPLAIARALQIRLSKEEDPAETVISALRDHRLLLILDNFEHLMDGRAWLVQLLEGAGKLQLLVTSRERLRLRAEDIYQLEGLSTPSPDTPLSRARDYDAVSLFSDLARRSDKQFRLDESRWPAVVEICRALQGLPLGIELAVGLLENASLNEIASRISKDALSLSSDALDIAPHQRSLLAISESSWQRLSTAEQETLARLSLMRGRFTWEDALIVGNAAPVTLTQLRHKSWLRAVGIGRLEMHDLVRQFAAVKLTHQPDWLQEGGHQHALLYLQRIGDYTSDQQRLRPAIQESLENIHAAWQWALKQRDAPLLLRAVTGFCRFHADYSLFQGCLNLLQEVVDLYVRYAPEEMTAVERELVTRALALQSSIHADLGSDAESGAAAERALALAPPGVDPGVLATIAYQRGRLALHQGRGEALEILLAGLADARRGEDRSIEAALLRDIGSVYRQRGDYLTFISYLEEALAIYQALDDIVKIEQILYFLGFYKAMTGRYWAGYQNLLAAKALNDITRSAYHEASIESCLGLVETLLGQPERGLPRHQAAYRQMLVIDGTWRTATLLVHMAATQMELGQLAAASESLAEAEQIARRDNLVEVQAHVGLAQGYCLYLAGDGATARQCLARVAEQMARLERMIGVVEAEIVRAYIDLEQQAFDLDQSSVAASLRYVAEQRLDGAHQRETLYRMAHAVAAALDLPLAPTILERGRAFVEQVAEEIEDQRWRQSYLGLTTSLHRSNRSMRCKANGESRTTA